MYIVTNVLGKHIAIVQILLAPVLKSMLAYKSQGGVIIWVKVGRGRSGTGRGKNGGMGYHCLTPFLGLVSPGRLIGLNSNSFAGA